MDGQNTHLPHRSNIATKIIFQFIFHPHRQGIHSKPRPSGTELRSQFSGAELWLTAVLVIVVSGLLLPTTLRGQAMGKAQVEAIAAAHLEPVTLAAPMAPVATPMLVALADTKKIDDPAKSDLAEPLRTSATIAAPVLDLAPATQPASTPAVKPATTPVTHADIESSLIRPSKASQPAGATTVTTGTAPGESSLYSRFASVIQVGGALAVVLGLIYIGRALLRKYVPGAAVTSGKGVMEIMARYPLAKNQSLVLVRIGSQLVVLNQTREASQSVLVIHDQVEVANILGQIQGTKPASIQQGFSNLLANARMDLESTAPNSDATIEMGDLDSQLDEMAAAKRQLMELRQQVRSVRESMPA